MRNTFILLLFIFTANQVFAQKSYIQVNGEPNLSVFLDGQFKGKTSAEYNGYIIENVNPGSHLIKIVKTGFTPFEETISVKAGEVFSYKVKPFTKHTVTISESGNSAATEKKAAVSTGKLVIQSVPIEIKITIPDIEGVANAPKTKDEWAVNDIPEGSYDLVLAFGGKTIKKRVTITGGEVTSVFANMMSGEFTVKSTLDAKQELARQAKYVYALMEKYGMKRGLTPTQFFSYNKDAERISRYPNGTISYILPDKVAIKDLSFTPGPRHIYIGNEKTVWSYTYALKQFNTFDEASNLMKDLANTFKQNVPSANIWGRPDPSTIQYAGYFNGKRIFIEYAVKTLSKTVYEVRIGMSAD
jgi:hypothetical protein